MTTPVTITQALGAKTQRVEQVNVTYGADYTAFGLHVQTTWSYDDAYPGLMFSDLASLRAQVDLVLGNGDGMIQTTEQTAFFNLVGKFGTQYVTSAHLISVNTTVYDNASQANLVENLGTGLVTSTVGVSYSYDCAYTQHGTIAVGVSKYLADVNVTFSSPAVAYKYGFKLVTGYELVKNATQVGSGTTVAGYLDVTVSTTQSGTGLQKVQLTIESTKAPTAAAGILIQSGVAYSQVNNKSVVLRYIVKVGANITFRGNDSVDPNQNPLVYSWNFDDGTTAVTMNKTVVHVFATAAGHRNVTLTVTDVAGLTNSTKINVTCDDLKPTPVISSKGHTIVSGVITIDQHETVVLNATYASYDDAAIAGDHLGVISKFSFDWGDGNKTGQIAATDLLKLNQTNTYQSAGEFNVTLNVTDVAGHFETTMIKVKVNDTTKPTVVYTVRNVTYQSNLLENMTLHFDASQTRDNVDNYTKMFYSWKFGDGKWDNGTGLFNVTHNYSRIGSIQVILNVTDLSGNFRPESKIINIQSGPRPNVIITRVYYNPGNFTEGSTGTILVNVTNTGSSTATNIVATFYIVPANGGPLQLIGTSSQMINATTGSSATDLAIGGKGQISFSYSAPSHGSYTIKVNVTSTNQLNTYSRNADTPLVVKSAPWKTYALWGGVAAVIIVVPLLIFLSRRWARREKKGPRRERKGGSEKPGSSDEL